MSFTTLVRRIHLYLALFLTPWILMYAIAVFSANHRGLSVDVAIAGMILWVLSGLWMWSGITLTRPWGLVTFGWFLLAL
jgi:hypothetical protein